jgi:type IV pilus assembly protein PilA
MMRNLRVRRGGFTLIEVMITVAIIGILAAIAIPRFVAYQHRSKRTEAMMNLEAIAKSEVAYFATNGVYFDAAPMPGGAFGPKRVWNAVAHAEFDELGYVPEGAVWYDYDANATVGCGWLAARFVPRRRGDRWDVEGQRGCCWRLPRA